MWGKKGIMDTVCPGNDDACRRKSVIPAKAYLGNSEITELRLSPEISEIGDWAFYHMTALKTIWIPANRIKLGKGIFTQCDNLRNIMIYAMATDATDESDSGHAEHTKRTEHTDKPGYIICNNNLTGVTAYGVVNFNMMLPEFPAKEQTSATATACLDMKDWLAEYDRRLLELLAQPANAGYEPMWFGGEEDYDDADTNEDTYILNQQLLRADMIYNRLIECDYLTALVKEQLQKYLCMMMTENYAPLLCILKNHSDEQAHVKEFLKAGCMNLSNADIILSQTEKLNAELRGCLLAYKQKISATGSIDDMFIL